MVELGETAGGRWDAHRLVAVHDAVGVSGLSMEQWNIIECYCVIKV